MSTTNTVEDTIVEPNDQLTTGDEYTLEELEELNLDDSDKLQRILEKKIAAQLNDMYITFSVETVTCIDITDIDNINTIE